MLQLMAHRYVKIPVYLIKKVHLAVRAKLITKGQSFSEWVRKKEAEELKR